MGFSLLPAGQSLSRRSRPLCREGVGGPAFGQGRRKPLEETCDQPRRALGQVSRPPPVVPPCPPEPRAALTPLTTFALLPRLRTFVCLPVEEKRFCQDCELLLLPGEDQEHASHACRPLSAAQLRRPSVLLRPLDNKKSNAQFLFSERSCRFLLESLVALGYRRLLCVGTPR